MAKVRNKLPMTVSWKGNDRREEYLDHLIKKNDCKVGVEVGVRFGRTLFHLLDHSKKAVIKDINAYMPLVKTVEGLLGHDIDYPSIQEALAELKINVDICPDNVWQRKTS